MNTMSNMTFDNIFKILSYLIIPITLYFLIISFNNNLTSNIQNEEVFDISFNNQVIDTKFNNLFDDNLESNSSVEKEILFKDLGVELAGIVSMKNKPDQGYIILNFINKKVNKNIFSPGDKIDSNVFLESIHANYIEVSIANRIYQI